MREYTELVYTPKESRIRHCIFLLTDYIQSHFLLSLGRLDIIYIFFDSRKIRISLFYIREHSELVYILQNRVKRALYIFSNRLYSEPFSFNFVASKYYLDFF